MQKSKNIQWLKQNKMSRQLNWFLLLRKMRFSSLLRKFQMECYIKLRKVLEVQEWNQSLKQGKQIPMLTIPKPECRKSSQSTKKSIFLNYQQSIQTVETTLSQESSKFERNQQWDTARLKNKSPNSLVHWLILFHYSVLM